MNYGRLVKLVGYKTAKRLVTTSGMKPLFESERGVEKLQRVINETRLKITAPMREIW